MCNFLSAILTKNGDLYYDPKNGDSHENLVKNFKLNDGGTAFFHQNFIRLEFTPPENFKDITDLSTWKLRVDENEVPDWFDETIVRAKLEDVVSRMLVSDKRDLLDDDCYILLDGAVVQEANGSYIKWMLGNSIINIMHDGAKVESMFNNSTIEEILDTSIVESMSENSAVVTMRDISRIWAMWHNATVEVMWDNSGVRRIVDNSRIEEMCNNSTVTWMYGNAIVGEMYGNSTIKEMCENAKVGTMYNNSKVEKMYDKATKPKVTVDL